VRISHPAVPRYVRWMCVYRTQPILRAKNNCWPNGASFIPEKSPLPGLTDCRLLRDRGEAVADEETLSEEDS
jgi:hypothetical protein